MRFIKAKWNNLILANYKCDEAVFQQFIPPHTIFDSHENNYYISLVAFMFVDTRVLGLPIPFHINFEEVNLRFYIKPKYDESKRAVTFIKEIVPKKAIEVVANSLFHEHYVTAEMDHDFGENEFSYKWKIADKWHSVSVKLEEELKIPEKGSLEEFISEHYWGYTKANDDTLEYEVKHEQWPTATITDYKIDLDYADVYGKEFEFLNHQQPDNVCFAKGSYIEVMTADKITE